MNFNQYKCGYGVAVPVFPIGAITRNGSVREFSLDVISENNKQIKAFETWLSTQQPIYTDPSIKDGVYKVGELEIVKQHFFMGEWLVLDNNQVSAYIDRGLEHRIYATLKQPVKQEEKQPDFLEYCKSSRMEFSMEMCEKFGWFEKSPAERVCIENLLICFDQLFERFKNLPHDNN